MCRDKKSFEKAGAQVVLVGMGTPSQSSEFAAKFNVLYPIVSDPQKKLYHTFGLKQMETLRFFSPKVALKGVAAVFGGHGIGIPRGDVRQLAGVLIINTAGQIVLRHCASNPADHPDSKTILAALLQTA